MRNLLNKAGGVAIAVATAAVLSSGSANAQAAGAEVTIDQLFCGVLVNVVNNVVTGVLIFPPGHPEEDGDAVVQTVITPSGNLKATCSGSIVGLTTDLPDKGARTFTFDNTGLLCRVNPIGLLTEDWHQVVTKSGRVALTCHGQQ